MDERLKRLLTWIAANSERESRFLSPEPEWEINSTSLVDEIISIWGLDKEEVMEHVNQ